MPELRFDKKGELTSIMLGERFTFKNGINASKDAFMSDGVKCIGVSDVYKCLPIINENIIGTVAISDKEKATNMVNYGDLLFQRSSETSEDIGHVSVYLDIEEAVCNGFVICGKPNELFYNPVCMHYALQNRSVRKQTIALGAGAQHYNIGQDSLAKIVVSLPPINEQNKIAELLTLYDQKISIQREKVKILKKRRKGLLQQIFSQKIRFKKDNAGSEFDEWEEKQLAELLIEYNEKCVKDGTYEHVSLTKEGVVPKSERYERDFLVATDDKSYRVTHVDDICYNPANLKFGVICRNKYKDAIFSPIYVTFRVTNKTIPAFTELLVTRTDFINFALKYQEGTVYERMAVSPKDLLTIKVMLPSLEEQQKIANFFSAVDEQISIEKKKLEVLQKIKKGLLQGLFE